MTLEAMGQSYVSLVGTGPYMSSVPDGQEDGPKTARYLLTQQTAMTTAPINCSLANHQEWEETQGQTYSSKHYCEILFIA